MKLSLASLGLSSRRTAVYLAVLLALIFVVRTVSLRPVPVIAHTVAAGPAQAEVMGTGTLAARVKVNLSPKIQGRLDDDELQQQVEIARAAPGAFAIFARGVRRVP
jgi:hypothetical protein